MFQQLLANHFSEDRNALEFLENEDFKKSIYLTSSSCKELETSKFLAKKIFLQFYSWQEVSQLVQISKSNCYCIFSPLPRESFFHLYCCWKPWVLVSRTYAKKFTFVKKILQKSFLIPWAICSHLSFYLGACLQCLAC